MPVPKFSFELKALKIGNKKPGDAICMRWGENLSEQNRKQFVCVVDAGANDSDADKVISCVKNDFGASAIDLLINTHPHDDHLGGFRHLIWSYGVKKVVLQQPWRHKELYAVLKSSAVSGTLSTKELERYHVKDVHKLVWDIGQREKTGAPMPKIESWCGGQMVQAGGMYITVLSPLNPFYVQHFKGISGYKEGQITETQFSSLEELTDAGDASCIHHCCYVLALSRKDSKNVSVLLTGDATVLAQTEALKSAQATGLAFDALKIFQIPHHGGDRNSRMSVLSKVLKQVPSSDRRFAFASVPKESDGSHPSKIVVDAIEGRGWTCFGKNDESNVSLKLTWS